MVKKGVEGKTPEDIVTNMENSIREIKGFAKLEEDRTLTMYHNLIKNLDKQKILAIIDFTNVESLKQSLQSFNLDKQQSESKSISITNVNYDIKDSVINRSDLSYKKD